MHASTAHAAYPPKSTYPSSADAEGGGREFRAVVQPTCVDIRVGIDDRTRQPVRQRPVCFPAGLRQQPDFPAREARRRGGQAMPEQYREGIRVSFGVSLGLLSSWLAVRSRILALFRRGDLTTGSKILTGS